MVSGAQAAFINRLLAKLPSFAPAVDPVDVVAIGATDLVSLGEENLLGIRLAYLSGLKVAFALGCAAMGVAALCSMFERWRRIDPEVAKNVSPAA